MIAAFTSIAAFASFTALAALGVAAVALRPHPARPVPASPASPSSGPATADPRRGGRAGRRHRAAVAAAYPDALELVVLCVRAGHLPAAAVRAALPHLAPAVAAGFAAVVARVEAGDRFADALAELPRHLGSMAQPLADSFAAAERYGLPLAPIVERLAGEARQQRRRRTEALARQLPVRLATPLVLCTLPSFVLLAVVPLLLAALRTLTR